MVARKPYIPPDTTSTPTPKQPRKYLSVDEACAKAGGVSRAHLYRLIKSGKIKAYKLGSRTLLTHEDIEAAVEPR